MVLFGHKYNVEFVWRQEFATREEARTAEHQIKKWSRAKKEALIDGNFDLLKLLAGRSQLSRALRVETPRNDVGSSATRNLTSPGVKNLLEPHFPLTDDRLGLEFWGITDSLLLYQSYNKLLCRQRGMLTW